MNTAAVIVNYNDADRVKKLVNTLLEYNFFNWIIVSDNGSNENDIALFDSLTNNERFALLKNGKNLGFSGANNIAFKWLEDKGIDYVFTINSDVSVKCDVLFKSIQFLEDNFDYSIVSAKMIEYGTSKLNYYNFPTIRGAVFENLGIIKVFKIQPKKIEIDDRYFQVDYIRSSYWCIRFKDFKEVNYFDENTFLYHVETCVGIKLNRIGKKCGILQNEEYEHNHIYKQGYKMRGYKDSYKSLTYIFTNYYKKNKFQMFIYKCSYYLGLGIRKMLRIR